MGVFFFLSLEALLLTIDTDIDRFVYTSYTHHCDRHFCVQLECISEKWCCVINITRTGLISNRSKKNFASFTQQIRHISTNTTYKHPQNYVNFHGSASSFDTIYWHEPTKQKPKKKSNKRKTFSSCVEPSSAFRSFRSRLLAFQALSIVHTLNTHSSHCLIVDVECFLEMFFSVSVLLIFISFFL